LYLGIIMLYYISNNRTNLCHSGIEVNIDISENNLNIGNYLLKINNISPWTWVQLVNLDSSFSFVDNAFYLKKDPNTNADIIEIREDISTGNAIIVGKFGLCPTQTPTPSVTPSNTVTPTPSETPPETPTVTPTQTVTPSSPLVLKVYYLSANLNKLCYDLSSALVRTLVLYIRDDLLPEGYFLHRNNIGTNRWLFNDLLLRLGLSSNINILYLKDYVSGIVYSIVQQNNFAVIQNNDVSCPPVYISNTLYDACHLLNNPTLNINTNNLLDKEYLYKNNGIDFWSWSELLALSTNFDNETTLYIYYPEENIRLTLKKDILTDNTVIVNTTTLCPTPTPTITPSQTNTSTPSSTQTNTPTPSITASPTQTSTSTPTPTPTITPSQTNTSTPSSTQTNTPTPSITASPTQTSTSTPTITPTSTTPIGGTYYYLSDNSYDLCHNETLIKFIVYDNNNILNINDKLLKNSAGTEEYSIEDLNNILGISDIQIFYIRPVDVESEWYRVRTIEEINNEVFVVDINDCVTPTPTPTITTTSTPTQTGTSTPTPTVTETPTQTPTESSTPTQTPTKSQTPTTTPTETPTETPTVTPTPSETPTNTPTNTESSTPTQTPTLSPTNTITPTETPTETPTVTPTPSETPTNTPTNTETPTNTITQTPTSTETPTPTKTTSYLIRGISININNITVGNNYEVEFGTDNYGIARIFNEKINFMATSDPQRVNVRVGFAANIPSIIVYVKVTDLDSGRVEYNSVFIKCSDIFDCY
jgi:hypothetical protein